MRRQIKPEQRKTTVAEQAATEQLVDLRSVSVDTSLDASQRVGSFLRQIRNPYLFRVDDITVKVEFSAGKSLEESLLAFFLAEKNR